MRILFEAAVVAAETPKAIPNREKHQECERDRLQRMHADACRCMQMHACAAYGIKSRQANQDKAVCPSG